MRFTPLRRSGYGILLAKYAPDMNHVTPEQYRAAQRGAIPQVAPVFWSFRIMVGCGSLLLVVMLIALIQTLRMRIDQHRWVLRMTLWSLPLPWIAIEAGWFMTEFGRQPGRFRTFCRLVRSLRADAGPVGLLNGAYPRTLHPVFNRGSLSDAEVRASWAERHATSTTSATTGIKETIMLDYETLRFIWWLLIGVIGGIYGN